MKLRIQGGASLAGTTRVPGDKSVTHRALLLAALCEGVTEIAHPGTGEDNLSTLKAIRALGAEATHDDEHHFTVRGRGLHGLAAPEEPIDCGNSGTTARLLAGLLAGANLPATLVGDASLSRRPMRRIAEPLNDLGYDVRTSEGGTLPLQIVPVDLPEASDDDAPNGVRAVLDIASAQVKSAILLSGLFRPAGTEVVEPAVSRDHTERMLRALGVRCASSGHYGRPMDHTDSERVPTVALHPPRQTLRARALEVPGDPSSAAFLLAAGLLTGGTVTVERMGTNPTRAAFVDVLARMGASVAYANRAILTSGEPVADVMVHGGALRATEIAGAEVPLVIDELPLLGVVAAAAAGRTEVRDARELRVKESDRIALTVALLRALGAEVEEFDDGFAVTGRPDWSPVSFDAAGDHRIGMAAAVAGLRAAGTSEITGAECIAVSYPTFAETLVSLGAAVEVR